MIFIILAGFINGLMDSIQFRYDKSFIGWMFPRGSKFSNFWNPEVSHLNKYKSKHSFIRLLNSTIFVYFTDGWHLLKLFFIFSIGFSIYFYNIVPILIIELAKVVILFSVGFNIGYEFKLIKSIMEFLIGLLLFKYKGFMGRLWSLFIYLFIGMIVYGFIIY